MSYAYEQLRLAMQYLTQSAPLHERLARALNESLCLRPKDLPTACRNEFRSLLDHLSVEHTTKRNTGLAMKIKALSDQEVLIDLKSDRGVHFRGALGSSYE